MAKSWTLVDKASGRILNMLKLPNKEWRITIIKFRNTTKAWIMNDLCRIISKIFAYETNVTKMEEGQLTNYSTWGTIQRDWSKITPILRAPGEQDTVSSHISDSGGRGRKEDDITRTADLSLFNFSLLESIHASMSRTQLANLALLRFISETDDVLNVIYSWVSSV